ncbi:MAG: hypothetical protein ACP5I1_15525 [Candidatus Hinthialibacter sp.]
MDQCLESYFFSAIHQLEAWGEKHQHHAHLQAFCGAPVQDRLKVIADQIPQIAREAGVDLIVSKWQIDYQAESIQLIDITNKLVKCFNPQEKALKWIEDLEGKDLIPVEEIEKHRH